MECRITVLCENTVQGLGLLGEHGFSAFIETPAQNILFDTGQGFGIIRNSLRLQKDLRSVSRVVLSHGHLDHTRGLSAFMALKAACSVAAHPDIFNERFRLMPADGGEEKPVSIGMPWPQTYLTASGASSNGTGNFQKLLQTFSLRARFRGRPFLNWALQIRRRSGLAVGLPTLFSMIFRCFEDLPRVW